MSEPRLQYPAGLTPMRWSRIVVCLLGAAALVFGLLAVSLRYYDAPREAAAATERSFEVEYLTPEEAAELLGER